MPTALNAYAKTPMLFRKISGAFVARPALFAASGGFVALVMAVITVVSLYDMRTDALMRARDAADGLSLLLSRDIERNLEICDLSLQAVIDGMADPVVLALPMPLRQRVLFDGATKARDLGTVLVADHLGNIVFDSGALPPPPRNANLSDRDYFKVQRDRLSDALFISKPFVSSVDPPLLSIGLSRRLTNRKGKFSGVVLGTLQLDYFQHLLDGMPLGPHGSITLVRTDGIVLMRRPFNVGEIGRSLAGGASFTPVLKSEKGSFVGVAILDGEQRLYSFRHIGKYPIIIEVGFSTNDIYAQWQWRACVIGGVMGTLCLLLVLMSILITRQFRERLEIEQRLRIRADTDSLTGLSTRRALDIALQFETRRAKRDRRTLSVLMLDIDTFKLFNDRYGHVAGDKALRTVALCIKESVLRQGDFAGRYGGEEFCVILPGTALHGALHVAQAIRKAVYDAAIPHSASPLGIVTISIGAATLDGASGVEMTSSQLIDCADRELYAAKAAGGNTVMPPAQRDEKDANVESPLIAEQAPQL
ncbi:sensor domain-containing diguanylate cyclase [Paraburkholderia unamae]|uniref:diguanylate cyclase n=1 Tax=Paraburkholderia unamae TaxID=219649 RepID=A0ABX5KT63_9BURK|nr:diguanylate cyclase [Paraburkholderia unamae]PVX85803.1 diguanylate cyclase (GGDEF)-like protein [Paraburkholderia unamae]